MTDGYGIGMGHSDPATNIEYGVREREMMQRLQNLRVPLPILYRRRVDDIIFIYEGTEEELKVVQQVMNQMDLNKPLEWQISSRYIDWCDLHLAIDRDRLTTSLYMKPTDDGRYLPWASHHPRHTFVGILVGEAQRMLWLHSEYGQWLGALRLKMQQFLRMGYPKPVVRRHLLDRYLWQDRQEVLWHRDTHTQQVQALVIPFTARNAQLDMGQQLKLFKSWAESEPELRLVASECRWVVADGRTTRLRDMFA